MALRIRALWLLFVVSAFTSAALLFASEPLVGRLLLPLFGGSSAVWNTCMVFFQMSLLLGYAYAHWSVQKLGLRYQPWLHLVVVLLPVLLLPLALPAWAANAHQEVPVWRLLGILTVAVGGPFFALATTGPLVQRWFAATRHPRAKEPYFLYAASNMGSFVALLGYPLLVEPRLSLQSQSRMWSVAYGLFVLLVAGCAMVLWRWHRPEGLRVVKFKALKRLTMVQRLRWVALAFIPSSLMLGVTTELTTDVAAVPLLWVIPLAVYLLTFVLAFGRRNPLRLVRALTPAMAAGLLGLVILMTTRLPVPAGFTVVFYLCVFAVVAQIAHARLAVSRPPVAQLTEFYLWVALGGALGGVFNSLVAPLVFNNVYEFPLVLLLSLPLLAGLQPLTRLQLPQVLWALLPIGLFLVVWLTVGLHQGRLGDIAAQALLAVPVALTYIFFQRQPGAMALALVPLLALPVGMMLTLPVMHLERTFYGVLKVEKKGNQHLLVHGATQHGSQDIRPERANIPSTYYHPEGPMGEMIRACRQVSDCREVGVLGLGTGALAAYGRQGDHMTFFEIDPAMVSIAKDPRLFTYITNTSAKVDIVTGDGRLSLGAIPDGSLDMLVMDAFSSDAVPVHLLTREALETYRRKLTPRGILAVHISNRMLDLQPVLFAGANSLGLPVVSRIDNADFAKQKYATYWVAITPSSEVQRVLQSTHQGWTTKAKRLVRPWTDDYSNILDAVIVR